MLIPEEDYIAHIGTLHKSGRYPWGSGDDPNQRNKTFLDYVSELHKQGMSDPDIARGMGMNTTELRAKKSIAKMKRSRPTLEWLKDLKIKVFLMVKLVSVWLEMVYLEMNLPFERS